MLFLFTVAYILSAQSETYSVDHLKLTDYASKSLSLTTGAGNQIYLNKSGDYEDKKSYYSFSLTPRFSQSKSNSGLECGYGLNLDIDFNNDNTNSSHTNYDNENKSNYYNFYSNNSGKIIKYFGQWHFGIDTDFYARRSFSKHSNYFADSLRSKSKYYSTSFSTRTQFPLGYGRLYSYKEAFLSWTAFLEMEKDGCLSRPATDAEIDELAKVFFSLKSVDKVSIIDSDREKTALILDYLIKSGILLPDRECDALAILLDTWSLGEDYSSFSHISFGQKTFGTLYEVQPYIVWDYDKYSSSYNSTKRYTTSGMHINFNHKKPLRNVWLLDAGIDFYFGWSDQNYHSNQVDFIFEEYDIPQKVVWKPYSLGDLTLNLTYFPGIRSAISAYYKFSYDESPYLTTPFYNHSSFKTSPEHISLSSTLGFKSNYRLNKQTLLSSHFYYENIYYKKRTIQQTSRANNINFTLALQYNIF